MTHYRGPFESDLSRFFGASVREVERGEVDLWRAARWATWLPRDAVTYLAIAQERQKAAEKAEKKKPDVDAALAAMRAREAERLKEVVP